MSVEQSNTNMSTDNTNPLTSPSLIPNQTIDTPSNENLSELNDRLSSTHLNTPSISPSMNDTASVGSTTNTTNTTTTTTSGKRSKRSHGTDVRHIARKLIMAWKQATESTSMTWKEVAPIAEAVGHISNHWKSDERFSQLEPIAVNIVSQVNRIHLELNLRVFGMNRLHLITEEFLRLVKEVIRENEEKEAAGEEKETKTEEGAATTNLSSNEETSTTNTNENKSKSKSKTAKSKDELLAKLVIALTNLFNQLNEPSSGNQTPISSNDNASISSLNTYNSTTSLPQSQPKHKSKKRNLFSGFFSSSSSQKNSLSSGNSSSYTNMTPSSSSSTLYEEITTPKLSTISLGNSGSLNPATGGQFSGMEEYRNNIVSEWQAYTKKFVEPVHLFKVCKYYLAASQAGAFLHTNSHSAAASLSLIATNWICVANEISTSLWNVLKKREDELASALIFLTLYHHGSAEIIKKAIYTIGSQLPIHLFLRLKVALKIINVDELSKEEQNMLNPNYVPPQPVIPNDDSTAVNSNQTSRSATPISSPALPTVGIHEKKSKLKSKKHDRKKNSKSSSKYESANTSTEKEEKEEKDEPLSFAEMLAM